MKLIFILFALLISAQAKAQLNPSDGQYYDSNFLKNPSFEQGKIGWSLAAGTWTVTNVVADVAHLKSAASVSVSGQLVDFSQTIGVNKGLPAVASVSVKTSLTELFFCVEVNSVTAACKPIDAGGEYKTYSLEIDAMGSTNTILRVVSFATKTGNVYVDDASLIVKKGIFPQNSRSIIKNGSFENGITGISCTGADPFSEDTIVVNAENNNLSLKIVTDGSVDWSCDIPLKGGMVGGEQFFYSLFSNTSLQTVEVCLFNGTIERNCQELAGISDWYEFYSGLNQAFATTNSLRIKGADSEATGTVYVDLVDAQLGLPKIGPSKNCAGGLDCENVFSATINGTPSPADVINKSHDWIEIVNKTSAGVYQVVFKSGLFKDRPSCSPERWIDANTTRQNASTLYIGQATKDHVYVIQESSNVNFDFHIICTKTGADFKPITEQGVVALGSSTRSYFRGTAETGESDQSVTSSATNLVVTYPTIERASKVSHSGGEVTIQQSGFYSIDFSSFVSRASSNSGVITNIFSIRVNGIKISASCNIFLRHDNTSSTTAASSTRYITTKCNTDHTLNRGDVVSVTVDGSVATTVLESRRLIIKPTINPDGEMVPVDIQGMVKVGGTTSRIETGWASFGQATDGSVCSSGACTRYRAVGDIGNNMSATRTNTGLYTVLSSGWKPASAISCVGTASDGSGNTREVWFALEDLLSDSNGIVSIRTRTTSPSGTENNTYFQVKCTGEVP